MDQPLSYYERNKEARKAYQRAYYKENRDAIARKRELDEVLAPEKIDKLREYSRKYYLENRARILAAKRRQYRERRGRKMDAWQG